MSGRRSLRSAFTLLEILLVIAILVILAGTATVMLMKQFQSGKVGIAKAAVGPNGQIAQALDLYNKDNNKYPDSDKDGGLTALVTPPSDITDTEKLKAWPYLSSGTKGLLDPWEHPYQYKCPGDHNTDRFDLWSTGQDGGDADGTRDGICNWDNSQATGGVAGKGP